MRKNINFEEFSIQLVKFGMKQKQADYLAKELRDDFFAFKTDDDTIRWAMLRGFLPGNVELYGLTNENYHNFLPDYNYLMIHPINNHFRIWVNDKLTLKYCLNNSVLANTMPEYYLYIENDGSYTYLMDSPNKILHDENYVLNLLKLKHILAIKPNNGSGGIGFMKLEIKGDDIYLNDKNISYLEFNSIIKSLTNVIVTEFITQHNELNKIYSNSICALRIVMCKQRNDKFNVASWNCICSFARFGTSLSNGASNLTAGGIGVGFDFESGRLYKFGYRKKHLSQGNYICTKHIDTHFLFENFQLPNWDYARSIIKETCQYLDSLDYLGFDVIITPNGIKFCEINTLPTLLYAQKICSPLFINKNAKRFFESKKMFDIDCSKFYEAYKNSLC